MRRRGVRNGESERGATTALRVEGIRAWKSGVVARVRQSKSADGETVWTIRCDVDKGSNGKAKKVDLDHEPSTSDMKKACPGDFEDAGVLVEAGTINEAGTD